MTGREERYDGFEGEPRAVGGALGGGSSTGIGSSTGHTGHHHGAHNAGPHNSNLENKLDPRVDSDMDGSRGLGGAGTGRDHHTGTGTTGGYGSGPTGSGYDSTGTKKPGLMDKLNPMKDSDHDGKRGIGE